MTNKLKVFGLTFTTFDSDKLIALDTPFKFITTVNAEFIVEAHSNSRFKEIINSSFATFDGQIPYFLAKLITRKKLYKISGSNLIYDVISKCKHDNLTLFLLGDTNENNQLAVERARDEFGIRCFGFSPPFSIYPFSIEVNQLIINEIKKSSPQYLFVGFGAKKQEYWIDEHQKILQEIGVKVVIGCGGTITFLSGKLKRAPLWIQRCGLEGVYRLIQQPKLFRLYRLLKSLMMFRYVFEK